MTIEYRGERFSKYNQPKRTPNHPRKSHAVLAKQHKIEQKLQTFENQSYKPNLKLLFLNGF